MPICVYLRGPLLCAGVIMSDSACLSDVWADAVTCSPSLQVSVGTSHVWRCAVILFWGDFFPQFLLNTRISTPLKRAHLRLLALSQKSRQTVSCGGQTSAPESYEQFKAKVVFCFFCQSDENSSHRRCVSIILSQNKSDLGGEQRYSGLMWRQSVLQTECNQALFSRAQRLFNEVLQGLGPNNSKHQAISTSEHTHTGYNLKKKNAQLKSVLKSFQLPLRHFYLVQMSCICICPAISTSWFCTHETLRIKLLNHLCHSCICISSISYLSNLRLSWLCCLDISLCIWAVSWNTGADNLNCLHLKGDPRCLLSPIVHSCVQSFVYLQEIHNRFGLTNQTSGRGPLILNESFGPFSTAHVINRLHKHLGNRSELVAGNFRKSSVFNLLHWMTLQL